MALEQPKPTFGEGLGEGLRLLGERIRFVRGLFAVFSCVPAIAVAGAHIHSAGVGLLQFILPPVTGLFRCPYTSPVTVKSVCCVTTRYGDTPNPQQYRRGYRERCQNYAYE